VTYGHHCTLVYVALSTLCMFKGNRRQTNNITFYINHEFILTEVLRIKTLFVKVIHQFVNISLLKLICKLFICYQSVKPNTVSCHYLEESKSHIIS